MFEVLENRIVLSLGMPFQIEGSIDWSIDATGHAVFGPTRPKGLLEAVVPPSSTIEKAFLYTSVWSDRTGQIPSITLSGTTYANADWTALGKYSSLGMQAWRADVTEQVTQAIDDAGTASLQFTVDSESPVTFYDWVDGEVLVIIYSNPESDFSRISLYDGFAEASTSVDVQLSSPAPDPDATELQIEMSLGIGFSCQQYQPNASGPQETHVDINGVRLTSSAGGADDGYCERGALITAGGFGDDPANPEDPYASWTNDPTYDDEYYTLDGFVETGDTSIAIEMTPYGTDLVFFLGVKETRGNAVPNAIDDFAETDEDVAISIDVAANDQDNDGNLVPSTAIVATDTSNGTISNNGDGSFVYSPNSNFSGGDSFTYEICDANGACDTADVRIHVHPVVDALIDVKPGNGDSPDPINLGSKGRVPIAILSTQVASGELDDFDASLLVSSEPAFSFNGVEIAPAKFQLKDVDGDGDLDLLLHVLTKDLATALSTSSVDLVLAVEFGGDSLGDDLIASDSIRIVPEKGKK